MVIEVLEPNLTALPAADHGDLCDFGDDGHTTRARQHGGERAGRPFDRVDALRPDGTDERDGRAVTGGAAHFDLRVGGLFAQLVGDDAADRFGGVARGADAARVGDKDKARAVDLHLFQHGGWGAFDAEKRIVHVLINRDAKDIARLDRVGTDPARILEAFRKAKRRGYGGGAGHTVIHTDDKGIAFALNGACVDLPFVRSDLWQTT